MKQTETEKQKPKHKVKDNLFCMLFNEPKAQLSLYNAFAGTSYTNYEDLTTVTLENALYLGMKNDCAFIMCDYMFLVEQQSTMCGNMPLRHLMYIAKEFEELIDMEKVYYKARIKLNNPKFIVFYNGKEEKESQWEERLSEAYNVQEEDPSLELKVRFYNINEGHNKNIKDACILLKEYGMFVDYIHMYEKQGCKVQEATNKAIDECINNNILRVQLKKERNKIMSKILYGHITEEEIIKKETRDQVKEEMAIKMHNKGMSSQEIAELLEIELNHVKSLTQYH